MELSLHGVKRVEASYTRIEGSGWLILKTKLYQDTQYLQNEFEITLFEEKPGDLYPLALALNATLSIDKKILEEDLNPKAEPEPEPESKPESDPDYIPF